MRLSDLIPDRDALLSRDYWWRRAQLGLPAPEFEPIPAFSTLRQPNTPVDIPRRQFQPQQRSLGSRGSTLQPGTVASDQDQTSGYGQYPYYPYPDYPNPAQQQ